MDLIIAIMMLGVLLAAFGLICVALTTPAWVWGRIASRSGSIPPARSPLVSSQRRCWVVWAIAAVGMAGSFYEVLDGLHMAAALPWLAFYAVASYAAYHLGWSAGTRFGRGPVASTHSSARFPAHMNSPVIVADETNIYSATDPQQTYPPYTVGPGADDDYQPATPTRFE